MEACKDGRKCFVHSRTIVFVQTDILRVIFGVEAKPTALTSEKDIVACNQEARRLGIFERMPISTALTIYPGLVTLNAADYILECKTTLDAASKLLLTFAPFLERIGLDQCFVDLSSHPLVKNAEDLPLDRTTGCACGCFSRLKAGQCIATDIQTSLRSNLNISSRIGVSYSKTLARVAAERCAVGECASVAPEEVMEVLPAAPARLIFPESVVPQLHRRGIRTIKNVRDMNFEILKDMVGTSCAVHVRNAAGDIDSSAVVPSDRWLRFSVECEIREKFRVLLLRLLSLAEENGRTPTSLKVTVRKLDHAKNSNFKEAKTGPIPRGAAPTLGRASPEIVSKLLAVVMSLFHRMVDVSSSFHLALLGLAFVRFEEHSSVRSVASCILRKRDLSVQTVVSISFEGETNYMPTHSRHTTPEPPDLIDEPGPSEKKAKLDIVIKKRKLHEDMDTCSPSKLRVGDLNINGDDVTTNGHNLIHC